MQQSNSESLLSANEQSSSPTISSSQDEAFVLTPLQKLIDKVDGQGRYQLISFLIMSSTWFLTSWLLLGIAFFFDETLTCKDPQFSTQDSCMKYVCSRPQSEWDQVIETKAKSIVYAFEDEFLICDNSYISTVLKSMVFVGSLIGFFIIPFIADNLGRKPALQISWVLCNIGVGILVVAQSPVLVGIGYFFAGLGSNPAITLCFSFINQQCLYTSRQRYGVFVQIFLGLGESTIGLVFIPDVDYWGWRQIMILLLAMVFIVNFSFFYLLETPKFLFSKSKEKTLQVLNKIAEINKRPQLEMSELEAISEDAGEDDLKESNSEAKGSSSIVDLFRFRSLRMITVATGFGFLGIQTIYYSTSLNLSNAGFSMLINQEIIGGSEIAGYLLAEVIISKIKRRPFSLIGMGVSSLMCLVLAVLTSIGDSTEFLIMETVGLIINRLVLCCFWSIFFVYVAELYPTRVRSLGYGWVSAVGMVGSTLSPYLIQASTDAGINTWIDPGVIGLIGTVFLFFLPETYGKPLQDEIEEFREPERAVVEQ